MGDILKLCWLAAILSAAVCLHAAESVSDSPSASKKDESPAQSEVAAGKQKFHLPLELIPDPSDLFAQLDQMSQLIQLTPDQLKQLRLTIEFLEKLSPEERKSMQLRLAEISEVSNARKSEVRHLVPFLPPRYHSDLSQLWMAASDEERSTIMAEIEPLKNWDKGQYLIAKVQEFVSRREALYSELIQSLGK